VRGTADAPGVTGQVVYLPQQNTAFLSIDNLPPPPAGRAYQVWYIQTGQAPVDAGLLPTEPSQIATRLQVDLSRYQAIAVSQEPRGGSRQPTGPVVLQAPLTTGNA
jgi:anti-sigma-K factor RskA